MKQTVVITRSTKLGFGWTTACEQTERGLQVSNVESPDYFGTVKTLTDKIQSDRDFQSLGGAYFSSAWFVKVDGEWKEFVQDFQHSDIHDLLITNKETGSDLPGYFIDSITVELA